MSDMMSDVEIAALSAADKLALAQRLLSALASDVGASASPKNAPYSSADMAQMQASLAVQVQQSLTADPAKTDWNAVRHQILETKS